MSNSAIILAVVLFFILIGFFVVVWKAASNWRWFHIVAVLLNMLLAIVFLFPTAVVLKSRSQWHKVGEELEQQLATVKQEMQDLKYGKMDVEDPSLRGGLIERQHQLSKLEIELGRRWRNLRLQNQNTNGTAVQVVLGAAPAAGNGVDGVPADAAAPAPPAAQPLVPEEMLVYAFAEEADKNNPQLLVPSFYLGEFRVATTSPTQVTLVSTGVLEPDQRRYLTEVKPNSWSLSELLPLDGHAPFIAVGSKPTDDYFFGRVDTDAVDVLLADASERTKKKYLEDGRRADDNDPPLSRWYKVEFLQNEKIEVDSEDKRAALDGGFFDGSGRAVDARLQRGDDAIFKKGDELLLKEEGAKTLLDEGIVKLLDRFYLRPLNDYGFVLRRIRLRLLALKDREKELAIENAMLQEAVDETDKTLVTNQTIKLKLEQDYQQFRVESASIREYTQQLTQQSQAMRAEMNRLEQENTELEQRLEQKHLTIERQLDALTAKP